MIDRLAHLVERVTITLKHLSDKLSLALDRAIYKLDKFRQKLILRFYNALHMLEKLFRVIWDIIKILVPIAATFVPPLIGVIISLAALTGFDSAILLIFSAALLLLLAFAYLAKDEGPDNYKVLYAQQRLKYLSDLSEYSIALKLAGALIGIFILAVLWLVSAGLALGIALFIVEFGLILFLPRMYAVPAPEDSKALLPGKSSPPV